MKTKSLFCRLFGHNKDCEIWSVERIERSEYGTLEKYKCSRCQTVYSATLGELSNE